MKKRYILLAPFIFLPLLLIASVLLSAHPESIAAALSGNTLSIREAAGRDLPFDSRPCQQHPSPQNCNGVLPFGPHFSVESRDNGSGYCFDEQRQALVDERLLDSTGKSVGEYQFWYLPTCQSYTSHLLFNAGSPRQQARISAEVRRFDSIIENDGFTKILRGLGAQDAPLPSETQNIGPLQANEIWSPMLYSPGAPVQGSATVETPSILYGPISTYYAAGAPTTINGQSV